jgi:phosphoglycolate phosphatase-like HAD superfamily hydrolase
MTTRALLIDFKVFAPIEINYSKARDLISKQFKGIAKVPSGNIFDEIDLVKEKASKKQFEDFALEIEKILDEIELNEVGGFPLNMGVKAGLETLDTLDVTVVGITTLGKKASKKFLEEKGLGTVVGKVVSRDKIGEPMDLGALLNRAIENGEAKSEESVYFCNKLADLKSAKSANFRAIALPSKGERLDLMMLEKPIGMIMSLEEIPNLLSLETARSKLAQEISDREIPKQRVSDNAGDQGSETKERSPEHDGE